MRLERFVAAHLNTAAQRDASKPPPSKALARALIAAGSVRVNGNAVLAPGYQVFLGNGAVCDLVEVEGAVVKVPTADRMFVVHKPAGILGILNRQARNSGAVAAGTLSDLVPDHLWSNDLAMLGRLDKPTTGLCVLARQEAFGVGALLLHPAHHVSKTYLVHLAHNTPMCFGGGDGLACDACRQFEDGVLLVDGTRCEPATLGILPEVLGRCVCAERVKAYQASNPCARQPPATDDSLDADAGGCLPQHTFRPDPRTSDSRAVTACAAADRCGTSRAGSDRPVLLPGRQLDPVAVDPSDAASAPGDRPADSADCHPDLPVLHTTDDEGCAAYTMVRVTITEGKFHQVKRMLARVGGDGVHRLHRETFGALSLDRMELPVGAMRPMRDEEYRMVQEMLPASRMCPTHPRSDNYGRPPSMTHPSKHDSSLLADAAEG